MFSYAVPDNILIFKQIQTLIYNFSKHCYISYLFKMFYILAKKIENFLNAFNIFLETLKIL